MAQMRKVETSLVIKAPVTQMHEMWSSKLHLISNICPHIVSGVDLLQGLWGVEGCVIFWNCILGGESAVAKEKMEVIDKENNLIVFNATEGAPLDLYKSFKWIFQASPDNSSVRWTLEYEKLHDNIPDPNSLLDLVVAATKAIDAHLITAAYKP